MERLAANILRYRKRRALTQRVAAERIGVTPNTWARWERGEVPPKLERLDDIAAVLGTTAQSLLK